MPKWDAKPPDYYELFVAYSRVTGMCSVGQVGVCIYPVCSMVHKFVFSRIFAVCVCVCVCICVCACDQKMSAYKLIEVIQMM